MPRTMRGNTEATLPTEVFVQEASSGRYLNLLGHGSRIFLKIQHVRLRDIIDPVFASRGSVSCNRTTGYYATAS
jgi:hypothetical protein